METRFKLRQLNDTALKRVSHGLFSQPVANAAAKETPVHCLNLLLPPKKITDHELKNSHCKYVLPE